MNVIRSHDISATERTPSCARALARPRSRHGIVGAVSLLLLAACGGVPDPAHDTATSQPTSSDHGAVASADAVKLHPDDFGYDPIADMKQVYDDFAFIQMLDSAGLPTQTDQILTDLGQLESEMGTLSGELETLEGQIANLYAAQEQGYILQTEQNVAAQLSLATSAIDEASAWVETGQTGPQMANALSNSLVAMNALSSPAYWYRPGLTAGAGNIFDPRMTITAYLAALTARVGVLTIYQPNFRTVPEYRSEFASQVAWMNRLVALMQGNVSCNANTGVGSSPATGWQICSQCTDVASGFQSVVDGQYTTASSPYCVDGAFGGTAAQATSLLDYTSFYDAFRVLDDMGLHVVQAMLPTMQLYSEAPFTPPTLIRIGAYGPGNWNNPGILNQGLHCLQAASNGGLAIENCSGASSQIWTTPNWGVGSGALQSAGGTPANTVTPANGACVEVQGWQPQWLLYSEACSGSVGEQWAVQQDGHIVWQHNTSYCLAVPAGNAVGAAPVLAPCANTPSQIWGRQEPALRLRPGGL